VTVTWVQDWALLGKDRRAVMRALGQKMAREGSDALHVNTPAGYYVLFCVRCGGDPAGAGHTRECLERAQLEAKELERS
jgi:hypothetical protein